MFFDKMKKIILSVFIAILFLCTVNMTVYASEIPDLNQKGSVNITMEKDGKPVTGGKMTIYYVGRIVEKNGDYSFAWTSEFENCGLKLETVQSEKLFANLEDYINKNNIEGCEKAVDSNGIVLFDNLVPGLYFVVQSEASDRYIKANSFLISTPVFEDGKYVYSVDASPKLELKTDKTTVPNRPSKPNQPTLPQTGMLNWPIPIMLVAGMSLFLMGWAMRYSGRKMDNEE